MQQIYLNACGPSAVRPEGTRSNEYTGVLADRSGVSTETSRKWRQRGRDHCLEHSARPYWLR